MKTLGKLKINPERIIRSNELMRLRGGYEGEGDSCGNSKAWYCVVHIDGHLAFSGTACGTQSYIEDVCQQLGYTCNCEESWTPMPIIIRG